MEWEVGRASLSAAYYGLSDWGREGDGGEDGRPGVLRSNTTVRGKRREGWIWLKGGHRRGREG